VQGRRRGLPLLDAPLRRWQFAAMKKSFALLALLLAGPASAQSMGPAAEPRFTITESGESFFTLQEAVRAVGEGRGTIRIAAGRYEECITQDGGDVAYVAARPGGVIFDTVTCEGKAAFVLRGRSARVEGIVFQNMQVPDRNGAGIRIEQGDLLVRESLFRNSESGILGANDHAGTVRIERSTFSGLGRCDDGVDCAHSIYINGSGMLTVANSRFERGRGGHYVKSRAPRIEVVDSSFDDSGGQATNYMIDLPVGANGTIARNAFVQGPNKENYSALIALAGEGHDHDMTRLVIAQNEATVAPGFRHQTVFVADWSGSTIALQANRLDRQITPSERRRR
jgi:hypothetical protein